MSTISQNITSQLKSGNKLYWIIGINIVVFLVALVFPGILQFLLLSASISALQSHFWTPITYMFTSDGFLGLIFNMLWLYWMGQIFEEFLGNKRILGLYLSGGLVGTIFFIAAYTLIPSLAQSNVFGLYAISGVSASVITIMVATTTLLPNHTVIVFIWPVKLKWLMLAYAILDLLNLYRGIGIGVVITHLGGALIGFVYIKLLQRGYDWISSITNFFKTGPKLSKLKVVARNNEKKGPSRPRQEDVDRILDKISNTGYESLNKEEKEILFRASKDES